MSTIGAESKPFEGGNDGWTGSIDEQKSSLLGKCRHGFPPQSPYLGFSTPTLCYINREETRDEIIKNKTMELGPRNNSNDGSSNQQKNSNVWDHAWPASHIIVCADEAELRSRSTKNIFI